MPSCLLHWLLCRSLIGAQAPLLPPPILWLSWAPGKSPDWMVNFILLISCRVKILENKKTALAATNVRKHRLGVLRCFIPETKAKWVVLVCFAVALDSVWPKAISWVCPWRHPFLGASSQASSCGREWRVIYWPCTGHPSVCFIDFPRKIDTVHYQLRCFDGNSHLPFFIEGYISHTPHLSFSSFLFFLSSAAQYMSTQLGDILIDSACGLWWLVISPSVFPNLTMWWCAKFES